MKDYTLKKIAVSIKTKSGFADTDFINDELTHVMEAYILQKSTMKQRVRIDIQRPKFTDWLFRRSKIKWVEFDISEIMKDPPKNDNFIWIEHKMV